MPAVAAAEPPPPTPPPQAPATTAGVTVEPKERDAVLPKDWRTSGDLAWTTNGDASGFHLLAADASSGYTWRTVATLAEPGLETDRWIGNACLTASGRRAVVAYAPRAFINKPELARRGAFTAVVDMRSGAVTKLPITTSLSYFNPGCGAGESAVVTQEGDEDLGATRLVSVAADSGKPGRPLKIAGQVTSAVPANGGIVAASGNRIVRFGADGKATPLAATTNVPFDLRVDADGGVNYLDRANGQVRVQRTVGRKTTTLAEGALGDVALSAGTAGRVFITGSPSRLAALPAPVRRINVPATAQVSTEGQAALTGVDFENPVMRRVGAPVDPEHPEPVRVKQLIPATGRTVDFTVEPGARASGKYAEGRVPVRLPGSPSGAPRALVAGSRTSPVDDDRYCSVPRNDLRSQTYQPTARQVEWAVDMAVVGQLNPPRPTHGTGVSGKTPQERFPVPALAGGGHVPPQVFLGILSQESNLWQADRYAQPGEYSNPLIGNFYGLKANSTTGEITDWSIHWDNADCGYGISQMTDGMRIAGHPRNDKDVTLPEDDQRAIALDYASNIAAGLSLITDKWNQLYPVMKVNNGDPSRIENWYYAAWAYNSGFYPQSEAYKNHGAWGLGWFNNPANPRYNPDRKPFLNDNHWADAAHPERWTYPEKIIGFASWSIDTPDGPGFRPAWWNTTQNRYQATPPPSTFCDQSNECEWGKAYQPTDPDVSTEKPGPCAHQYNGLYDLHCYYHQSNFWKLDCPNTCGHELIRFDPPYAEPADGTHFPAQCDQYAGLPSGFLVVDDVPDGTYIPRCGKSMSSAGTFSFDFDPNGLSTGTYTSKIDLHQLGGGDGGHFWFVHTRQSGDQFAVRGTWTLDRQVNGWARVMVHTPDHGAHSREAKYRLNDTLHSYRVVPQRTQANKWVSLGVFQFAGTPKITLSNETLDGTGDEDIAWDAVAVQPLPAKPRDFVVAMGDSYSSGEGASAQSSPSDYYKETDVDGADKKWRDACHRSPYAWSRQARLADSSVTIGDRADRLDPSMDYHFVACSGAVTANVLDGDVGDIHGGDGQYGELPQMAQGYLDENTTLVTLSIGGNNARFSDVVKRCIYGDKLVQECQTTTISGDSAPLSVAEPERIKGPVRDAIKAVLLRVHVLAPNAKIMVMGYPRLLEGSVCSSIPTILPTELNWMNAMAELLDQQMAQVADDASRADVPVTFSDPREYFAGKAICGDPESIHGVVKDHTPGDEPLESAPASAQSFHPKISGAGLYANSATDTLRKMGM
ncbi:golvesin C-terminal-like domain-containing protein [Sphaerisporangium fuscum]|uniref:golvesin C-terminal-like domain-containing protein n=1 Tax=Sphaerisporangium fuscum TaxID=2835868 RepID=UPI001BDC61EE|nr:GDSL-type esterase/lipase family protein [Sphaerisporangium fuscum]